MPMALALVVFFLCWSPTLSGGVRIGAFTDLSSRIGREQAVALEIAAQDFSSTASNISLIVTDSSKKAGNLIPEWGVNAIIAAGPWPEVVQIIKVAEKTRTPVLSLAASQPLTAVPKPHFFRLSSTYIQCIASLIELYNWRQVIVLYEEDDYGSASASVIPLLNNALQDNGSKIYRYVAFPPFDSLDDPKSSVRRELKKLKKDLCTVYIVVRWSSPSLAIVLFEEAKTLGMMAKGHVWIIAEDITTLLDSTFTPTFISSCMQGVIGIKTYFNESTESYYDFSAKFRQRFEAKYREMGENSFEPGVFAVKAYDAVHAIAQARMKHTLLEGIQSTDLIGLSGRVQFITNGDLMEETGSPTFHIINIIGKSYKELGFWSKGIGFYRNKREMGWDGWRIDSLDTVYWPGGPEKVPGGWRKLRIGIPAKVHLLVQVEIDRNGKLKNVSGFCIDVFMMARELLKYYLGFEFIPFNGTYDNLVASVPEVFDAAVGDIAIVANRSENATFTEPFIPSGLSRVVQLKPDPLPWVLTKPFTNAVWFLFGAVLIYNCFCIWYLEHGRNPEFSGPWWNQVGAALWLIFSSIFFANGRLHSYHTKAVIVAWFFVVLILTSSFTANLSSILYSKKFEPALEEGNVGITGPFAMNYLRNILGYKQEQIVQIDHIADFGEFFDKGIITSAYLTPASLRMFLANHDGYTVYGETYNIGSVGFAFPKGSPLAADFSQAILKLLEQGKIKELQDKYFSLSFTTCPISDMDGDSHKLGVGSFWALFLFTGVASTIVLFIFKARLCQSCRRQTRKFVRSWRHKPSWNARMRQLYRRHSTHSKRAASELAATHPPEV